MDNNLLISICGTVLSAVITSAGTIAVINYRLKKLEENLNELSKEVKGLTTDVLVLKTEKAVKETYVVPKPKFTRNSRQNVCLVARKLDKLMED